MIDLQLCRKVFNQYFKEFDIKNPPILRKFHHSYRVMEYSRNIAKFLKMSEEDICLAQVIGLLHDIGRFSQWTDYKTYNDFLSVDHGNLSREILIQNKMLESMHIDHVYHPIILDAVQYHNKYSICEIEDEKIKLFTKIIRDADKIDIFLEQNHTILDNSSSIRQELYQDIINKKLCNSHFQMNELEYLVRSIGFLFDMNFDYSIQYLCEKNAIENKLHLLTVYLNDKDMRENIEKVVREYVEERILC